MRTLDAFPGGPDIAVIGMIVRVDPSLPEGIIMFKTQEGRVLGIIDNRAPK